MRIATATTLALVAVLAAGTAAQNHPEKYVLGGSSIQVLDGQGTFSTVFNNPGSAQGLTMDVDNVHVIYGEGTTKGWLRVDPGSGVVTTLLVDGSIFDYHKSTGAAATIGIYRRKVPIDFGIIETDAQNRLADYIEKPTHEYTVSMGVNIFNKDVVSRFLEPGIRIDIPELMLKIKHAGYPVHCYEEECTWLDIGRVDDYQNALETFEARRSEFLPDENA